MDRCAVLLDYFDSRVDYQTMDQKEHARMGRRVLHCSIGSDHAARQAAQTTQLTLRQISMLAHVVTIVVALRQGLGSSTEPSSTTPTIRSQDGAGGRAAFAANMLYIVTLALGKCSVAMFVQRLVSCGLKKLYYACYLLVAISSAWALGSMIGLGAHCYVQSYLAGDPNVECVGQVRTRLDARKAHEAD